MKIYFLLLQMGTPAKFNFFAVRKFLRLFLGNNRIIEQKTWWKKIFFRFFVANIYALKSCRKYSHFYKIYFEQNLPNPTQEIDFLQSPMMKYPCELANKLREQLQLKAKTDKSSGPGDIDQIDEIEVLPSFIFSSEMSLAETMEKIKSDNRKSNCKYFKLIFLPQFPQYCEATTALAWDMISAYFRKQTIIPRFEFIPFYYDSKAWISAYSVWINLNLQQIITENEQIKIDALVISFHGMPRKRIEQKGDLYLNHCIESYRLLKNQIELIDKEEIYYSFQSKWGRGEWLGPDSSELIERLITKEQKKNIAMVTPGFAFDCIETSLDIEHLLANRVHSAGGKLFFIGSLNSRDFWVEKYSDYLWTLAVAERRRSLHLGASTDL